MGSVVSVFRECFPPQGKWSIEDMEDMKGVVCIVTGGYAGIGKEISRALLNHNATVYIAGRDCKRGEQAVVELGGDGHFLKIDLADPGSVRQGCEAFLKRESKLHILFNNAGVAMPPMDWFTVEGYDLQFGTNVLGHFLLTNLLLPTLIGTGNARVVIASSFTHHLGKIDYDTLRDGPKRRKLGGDMLYAQSKYACVVMAMEFARRYGEKSVIFCAANPGNVKTEMLRHKSKLNRMFVGTWLQEASQGGVTPLWAGTSREGESLNGKYVIPWGRQGNPNPATLDAEEGRKLWEWLSLAGNGSA